MTLDQFIANWGGFPNNLHVEHKDWKTLYARRATRVIKGEHYDKVLDLANIEAWLPGTGAFTRLVAELREKYPHIGLYVESVLVGPFRKKLTDLGFENVDGHFNDFSPSFFLPPKVST